jgi:hypothetical protein
MLSNELQKVQWHNSLYMKLRTCVNHATMLQLNHYNNYVTTLQLPCHSIVITMPSPCNYIGNDVLKNH